MTTLLDIHLAPADTLAPEALHAACVAAYADYLAGPISMTLAQWPAFVARQGTDLAASRVALDRRGNVLAFAYAAPRPAHRRWRLAGMAAVPAARGGGAAPALLDDFLRRAAAAGQQAVELEVFAGNERAVRLYRGRGFETRHALYGFERQAPEPAVASALDDRIHEVVRDAALTWLDAAEASIPELPLQVTAASLRHVGAPLVAWQHGTAQLLHTVAADGSVSVASLVDRDPEQRSAQVLVDALLARHAGSVVRVPQLQRDDLGGQALRRAGFAAMALHQVWMQRTLA